MLAAQRHSQQDDHKSSSSAPSSRPESSASSHPASGAAPYTPSSRPPAGGAPGSAPGSSPPAPQHNSRSNEDDEKMNVDVVGGGGSDNLLGYSFTHRPFLGGPGHPPSGEN